MHAVISNVLDRFRLNPSPVQAEKSAVERLERALAEIPPLVEAARKRYADACVRLADDHPDASVELDAAEVERDALDRKRQRLQVALHEAHSRAQLARDDEQEAATADAWKKTLGLAHQQEHHLSRRLAPAIDLLSRHVLTALKNREALLAAMPKTARFDADGPLMTRPLLELAIKSEIERMMPWPTTWPWGREAIPKLADTSAGSLSMIRSWAPAWMTAATSTTEGDIDG